jgi:hypothetical protein
MDGFGSGVLRTDDFAVREHGFRIRALSKNLYLLWFGGKNRGGLLNYVEAHFDWPT